MAQPQAVQAVPVASLETHFCPFAAPKQLALVLAFCTRSWGALNSDFSEESKTPRDEASKLESALRVVSKVKELKWGLQGVWVGPFSPQGKVVQAPFPTGSLFHEPAVQMGSQSLAKLFFKAGDLYLVKVEIIPSTFRHWWLGCWELDQSPCPPDGEKQNHNSNSSDLIWVLHYFWKCWRIKVSQEETLNLVFFLLIHSKANPLLSWQVCSSSGEVSPGCSWMLFLKVLRVPGILKLWGLTQISGSPSFQVKRRI